MTPWVYKLEYLQDIYHSKGLTSEETCLESTHEETQSKETTPVLDGTLEQRHGPPSHHQGGQNDFAGVALGQEIEGQIEGAEGDVEED